jgi:hypothetical protein
MRNTTIQNSKFPFCCPVLWVSLTSLASMAVALFILAPIILLYYEGYISTEATVWAALGVFVAAVIYDYFLLFLINRNDKNTGHHSDTSNSGNLSPDLF